MTPPIVNEYLTKCKEHNIKKPNKEVIDQLEEAQGFEELESLDLSRNYVGNKGMLAIMEVIAKCKNFSTLVVGQHNAELSSDNEFVDKIMQVAAAHPSMTSIDFMGNPVTAYGAKKLLDLARENEQILYLHLDDDELDQKLKIRIREALEANLHKMWAQDAEDSGEAAEGVKFVSFHVPDVKSDDSANLLQKPDTADSAKGRRRTGISAELMRGADSEEHTPVYVEKSHAVKDQIRPILLKNPLFNHLAKSELKTFLEVMFPNTWEAGTEIMQVGTPGKNFYMITKGAVDIIKEGNVVAVKKESEVFGELELMYNTNAVATVKAQGEVETWAISRKDYQYLMMDEMVNRRKTYTEILSRIPITQHLSSYEKLQIADALDTATFEPGQKVISQGEQGDVMYMILEGSVDIRRTTEDGEVADLGGRGVGEYFGEFEFLFNVPRFCDVIAKDHLRAAFIKKKDFELSMGPTMDILKRNAAVYRFYVSEDGSPADRNKA
jgi:CRP-like cAMP-binding protein/septum formation inhibitor MinC|eukprot:CAMPEP_0174287220 /NCGR_PEP_ID=MMETSP0809-20121228/14931_1 /TAXON_ID=73025 ORGANISM="Eutreptiella gymnastica-like, Strain CCMP1594" /NCGR_SAMPLE_ID=MMETSP0809 /ASSEMBLY_ACC=CAM_ASM_000658 /LENGTH=494 /DNA_ID=CAMNT_0015383663 /DNA_START=62 /DNA_END=1546 /DNA_ORIENTATION=+